MDKKAYGDICAHFLCFSIRPRLLFALIEDIWNTKRLITLELIKNKDILMKFVVDDRQDYGIEWWWKSRCGSIVKPATPTQPRPVLVSNSMLKKLGRHHDSQKIIFCYNFCLHSPSKCLAWVKKCCHVWLDQNCTQEGLSGFHLHLLVFQFNSRIVSLVCPSFAND